MSLELPSDVSGHFLIIYFQGIEDIDSVNENCDILEFNVISVCADDISNVEADLPVITNLSGYCAYAVMKNLQCTLI